MKRMLCLALVAIVMCGCAVPATGNVDYSPTNTAVVATAPASTTPEKTASPSISRDELTNLLKQSLGNETGYYITYDPAQDLYVWTIASSPNQDFQNAYLGSEDAIQGINELKDALRNHSLTVLEKILNYGYDSRFRIELVDVSLDGKLFLAAESGSIVYNELDKMQYESSNSESVQSSSGNPTVVTTGMRNALNRAKEYLSVMPFSHTKLIEQLEYEGYTGDEAAYGASNCGANWNEQAALKAAEYLAIRSFSRSGLIDQLIYEGFTRAQAEYGVTQVGY